MLHACILEEMFLIKDKFLYFFRGEAVVFLTFPHSGDFFELLVSLHTEGV